MKQRTHVAGCVIAGMVAFGALAARADDVSLQEIVVTAQKREQNVQQVPIAITAVTGEELAAHIGYDVQQITMLVPGLQFSLEGEDVNVIMRGSRGGGVSLYQDGIYRQVSSEFQAVMTDTSRVEVSRGPQGTLSGRNSMAGAVNVVTNPPEYEEIKYGFNATVYNYSGIRDELFVNYPLINDLLAARVSAYRERQDGVMVNIQNPANSLQDRNNDYVRFQLGFKPTDSFNAVLRVSDWHGGGNGSGDYGASTRGVPINPLDGHTSAGYTSPAVIVPRVGVACNDPSFDPNTASEIGAPGSTPPLFGGIPSAGACNQPADPGPYVINQNAPHIRDISQQEVNSEINWDFLPGLRFRALLAYVNYSEYRQDDGDYGPSGGDLLSATNPDNPNPGGSQPGMISINEDYERTRTQELQVLSTGKGRVQWVLGSFLEQNSSFNAFDYAVESSTPGAPPIVRTPRNFNNNPQTLICCGGPSSDFAWYFPLRENLNSYSVYGDAVVSVFDNFRILGGARYTHDSTQGVADFWYAIGGQDYPSTAKNTFTHVTWRGGLEYDVARDHLAYFTASTGFIAGGPNPGGVAPYGPQTSKSYELGSKNLFADGRLRINADVYYVEYDNLLVSFFNPANSLTTSSNEGSSHAAGLELESEWRPVTNFHIRGVLSLLRSRYGNFAFGPEATLDEGQNLPPQYGAGAKGFVADGLTTRNAPKVQANTTAEYDFNLGGFGVFTPAIDETYVSKYKTRDVPLFYAIQNSYWETNLRLTWHREGTPWSVMAYVTNLENEPIRIFSTPNQGGIIYDQYQDPRIFGVRFTYRSH